MLPVLSNQKGQGWVEYVLTLIPVAIVVIVILALLGPQIRNVVSSVIEFLGGG